MILTRRSLLRAAPALVSPLVAAAGWRRNSGGGVGILTSLPPSGSTLNTAYGTWSWGTQVANPGFHALNGWFWVKLNGKVVIFSSQNVVAYGGQFFIEYSDGNWFCFQSSYGFFINCSGPNPAPDPQDICAPYGFPAPVPPPANAIPPFTPSPDNTSITAPSGTVTSVDGVWTWGAHSGGTFYNIVLNGIPIVNLNASQLEINSQGNLFLLRDNGPWYAYLNYALCPAVGPTAGPIPIAIALTPSFGSTPFSVSSDGAPGTFVCSTAVTMSDGSAFTGILSVGPSPIGQGADIFAANGTNTGVVLKRQLTTADEGTQVAQVSPVQNGVTMSTGASIFNTGIGP